jgi:hypothetical protein
MKRIGLLIVALAGLIFVLPALTAQDGERKDPEKTEKKDEAKKDDKKDPEKKDEPKKDPEKKDEEKKKNEEKKSKSAKDKKPIEKMPAHGAVIRTKIISLRGEGNREFTIELQEPDPKKIYDFNIWKAQQTQSLAQQQRQMLTQKGQALVQAMFNYQKALTNFNVESAQRSANLTSPKPVDVRGTDDVKVRTAFLPVQFDDNGFPKKWTEKEKKELRGDTQIPGYPSDFDQIKSGQYVDIYLVKKAPPPKADPKKKKAAAEDDPPEMAPTPEVVVIVILQEAGKQ